MKPDVFDEAIGMTIDRYGNELIKKYDDTLREKMIQQLWFKTKGLSKKNPTVPLSIVERIINETKVEK